MHVRREINVLMMPSSDAPPSRYESDSRRVFNLLRAPAQAVCRSGAITNTLYLTLYKANGAL
jgi:hypothetical protein